MIPLLRHLYPWVHYYPCHIAGRLAEDCWQIGALTLAFRPAWMWDAECAQWGLDASGGELAINTPWLGLLWTPE